MAKGDAYIGITKYLEKQNAEVLSLSFNEIKCINGNQLPASAYKHTAWWANTESHSEAYGWLNAGYKTTEIDLANERITFERIG